MLGYKKRASSMQPSTSSRSNSAGDGGGHIDAKTAIEAFQNATRHLCKQLNLYGQSEIESARVDELCRYLNDCKLEMTPYYKHISQTNASVYSEEEAYKHHVEPMAGLLLPILNKALESTRSGFLLRSGISYVDFLAAECIGELARIRPTPVAEYPLLVELQRRIYALPTLHVLAASQWTNSNVGGVSSASAFSHAAGKSSEKSSDRNVENLNSCAAS